MNQLVTAYVTGVPQFIYANGIPECTIKKVVFVQLVPDEARLGIRPFEQSQLLMKNICESLNISLDIVVWDRISELERIIQIGDILDCQILFRFKNKKENSKFRILAAQHEYVNFNRPSAYKIFSQSMKKRIDLVCKVVIPNRLFDYYSLSPVSKRGILKERVLDQEKIKKVRDEIFTKLKNSNKYPLLETLQRRSLEKNVCFVLPYPAYGEGKFLNQGLFSIVENELQMSNIDLVIIKNHPSDETNYSGLLPKSFTSDNTILLFETKSRTLPLEILVQATKSYQLIGAESTVFMTLSNFVSSPTIIIDSNQQTKVKFQKYRTGETRSVYKNIVISV